MTIKDIINFHNAGLTDDQILAVAQTMEAAEPERAEAEAEQPATDFAEYFRKLDEKITAIESRLQSDALSSARQPADAFKPSITADDVVKKIINGGR